MLFLFFIKNYLPPCNSIDEKQGNTWLSQRVAIICYHEVWLHIRKSSRSRRWVSFLTLLRVKQSTVLAAPWSHQALSLLLSPQARVFHPEGHMVLAGELWSEQEEEGRRKREVPWFSRKVEGGDYLEEGEVGHQEWSRNAWLWKSKDGGHSGQSWDSTCAVLHLEGLLKEFITMAMTTLYARQQKRHRCV